MEENYLYTAYTLYKWECESEEQFCEKYDNCQTMVIFYTDKVDLILTDENNTKHNTFTYKEFEKNLSHCNFYDIEIDN
tara:strand:+ start:1280 stop:1513 length:234 start_codon:yes stop_codon:yes gene_type:complete